MAPSKAATAEHEHVLVERGVRSGATIAIAVHSTVLGPALGGVRLWHYERDADAVADALRLSRAMTYKAAAADLDLGGGKGVICAPAGVPPAGEERRALLLDFGELVESLAGSYYTAEDVGIAAADMITIAEQTSYVTGLPFENGGAGDPSPFTAVGVQAAMRAACAAAFGSRSLEGVNITIVGAGHVGEHLARGLVEAGAHVALSDIDSTRRAVANALGARWVEPGDAMADRCDVLAPCAVGGAIHAGNVGTLSSRIVCGAANNQLDDDALADRLRCDGVLYAPDFVANAGGIINVYRDLHDYGAERATQMCLEIERTMDRVLAIAAERGVSPLAAALELARARLVPDSTA